MCFVLVNISAHAHDNTHAHTCSISLHLLLSARYFFLCSALLSSSSCTVLPSSSLPPGPSSTCRNIIKKNTWLQISCLSSAAKITFCTKFSQNVEYKQKYLIKILTWAQMFRIWQEMMVHITSPDPNSTPPGSNSASKMCPPNRGGKAKPEKSSII